MKEPEDPDEDAENEEVIEDAEEEEEVDFRVDKDGLNEEGDRDDCDRDWEPLDDDDDEVFEVVELLVLILDTFEIDVELVLDPFDDEEEEELFVVELKVFELLPPWILKIPVLPMLVHVLFSCLEDAI